jgi:hypothetical protein
MVDLELPKLVPIGYPVTLKHALLSSLLCIGKAGGTEENRF